MTHDFRCHSSVECEAGVRIIKPTDKNTSYWYQVAIPHRLIRDRQSKTHIHTHKHRWVKTGTLKGYRAYYSRCVCVSQTGLSPLALNVVIRNGKRVSVDGLIPSTLTMPSAALHRRAGTEPLHTCGKLEHLCRWTESQSQAGIARKDNGTCQRISSSNLRPVKFLFAVIKWVIF